MKNNFTVVICVLNSQYIHSSLAPWCLLAGINKYCVKEVTTHIVEGTINEKIEDVAQRVIDKRPDVVGFSCYIWNIKQTEQLISLVKKQVPDSKIILGGPEVSYNAEEMLGKLPLVDYVISGEGEKPFAELIDAVQEKKEPGKIPGVCYRGNGLIINSAPNIPDEIPPTPYGKTYFQSLNGRIAYLESSRGCPYSCAYCLSGRCGSVRYYNIERTKKEMLLLANSGTKTIKFVDRTFNANRIRAFELFAFVIKNYGKDIPNGVCFHFEIAGDLLDEETINLLATAPTGSIQLEIGLQSFNPKTLEAIHRRTDVNLLNSNIQRLMSAGNIHIHIDLIAGLPYEGWESFAESFNIAYRLRPNMLQLGFLKLLHGAPMREKSEEFPCKYDDDPPYEVIETPWLSHNELIKLHYTEDALNRLSNSGRFRQTLDYLFQKSGYTPFELFYRFGSFSSQKGTDGISLDNYTALAFEYFSKLDGIDSNVLRDRMIYDRISTNSSGRIPPVLRIKDPLLKKYILKVEKNSKPQIGIKRGYAILYTENCLIFADYNNRNPITGEFKIQKILLDELKTVEL